MQEPKTLNRVRPLLSVALVALLVPFASATTFAPAYQYGGWYETVDWGINGEYEKVDTTNGVMGIGVGAFQGEQDRFTWMGGQYNTNGDGGRGLLGTYQATVSAHVKAKGHMTCIQGFGGNAASLTLSLRQLQWTGSQWQEINKWQLNNWDCKFISIINDDSTYTQNMWFEAGKTYAVLVEAKGYAYSILQAEAYVDFCSSSFWHCGTGDEQINLFNIAVPNQAPKARADGGEGLFVLDAVNGHTFTGSTCDPDGSLNLGVLNINGVNSASSSSTTVCKDLSASKKPLTPTTYSVQTVGRDTEGAQGSHTNTYRSALLPFGLGASAAGYPDLGSIPLTSLGSFVTVQTLQAPDGTVRGYRVTSDNTVHMDTLSSVTPNPGDVSGTVEYDRLLSFARAKADGIERWSGAVAQTSTNWWGILPAGTIEPVADPAPTVSTYQNTLGSVWAQDMSSYPPIHEGQG